MIEKKLKTEGGAVIKGESLFNIPYWKIQVINFEEKKKEQTKLLESYPEEKRGFQYFFTNRTSDVSGLAEGFLSIMKEEISALSKEIKKDLAIMSIWSLSYEKNDFHQPHNHGSTGITAILYLDLPKESPVTEYIQPWNDFATDLCPYNALPVVEGDIVIVPSFVFHFSNPNQSNNKKRIISWDMKIVLDINQYRNSII